MLAEIISVGTELLMGQIANTDAQYIAQKLAELGIDIHIQQTIGDNMERLTAAIELASGRSDLVILSGGLGPTEDDMTKDALASYLGVGLVEYPDAREHLENWFEKYNRCATPNNYRQAMFPEGAKLLSNSCGTAPGCVCEKDGKRYIVLPGPPHELKVMMDNEVVPLLAGESGFKLSSVIIRVYGRGESDVEYELRDLIDAQTNPTIAPYAGISEMMLRVTAKCKKSEDVDAMLVPTVNEILRRLNGYVYSTDGRDMPETVARLLIEKGKTIAVAESLTGGMICSDLVAVSGMSAHLLEGVVAYTNAAKMRLGVAQETLRIHTAVSEECAIEMAREIRLRSGADIGVSATGVAGPNTDGDGNPVGLVYAGISTADKEYAVSSNSGGIRQRIRVNACLLALNEVRRTLESWD